MHVRYTSRGPHSVAIIRAPKIFGNRLGYLSKTNDELSSWALRDYIGDVGLRSGDSKHILTDIEDVVEEDYPPAPYRPVGRADEWANDLETRSRSIFGPSYDAATPPNASWGTWKPLPLR